MLLEDHFIQRLKERYSIDIDYDEYYGLCKKPVEKVICRYTGTGRSRVIINIKGEMVVAIKHHKKGLVTALPYNK